MNAWRKWIPLFVALLILAAAFGWLFQLRLGGGDVYPPYSSLRSDALGTRAFYEALGLVPGLVVDRDYRPLAKLGERPRVLLLLGLIWQPWQSVPARDLAALNAAASNGARVVLAFRADQKREDRDKDGYRIRNDAIAKDDKTEQKKSADKSEVKDGKKENARQAKSDEVKMVKLAKEWGVTLKLRWIVPENEYAIRADGVEGNLPPKVDWHSDLYFSLPADSTWRVLYRRGGEPVVVEKKLGRGSLVLAADAYFLSNEAMNKDRSTALLSWLVGDFHEITFVESSLGVLEENGVGFLARRYGLGGAMALTALLGILYAWRRLVPFVPPLEPGGDGSEVLVYEPAAGFTTLLRRSLGAAELLPACIEEWRKSRRNSAGGGSAAAARLDAAWQMRDPKKSLSSHYNALARSLKPR